jgi:hypothetical protein
MGGKGMKITETIERDCCARIDLKPYLGLSTIQVRDGRARLLFCIHCGQIWRPEKFMDAAGSMDSELTKVTI